MTRQQPRKSTLAGSTPVAPAEPKPAAQKAPQPKPAERATAEKVRFATYIPVATIGRAKAAWPKVHAASTDPDPKWRSVDEGAAYGSLADWISDVIERAVQTVEAELNNGRRFEPVDKLTPGRPAR